MPPPGRGAGIGMGGACMGIGMGMGAGIGMGGGIIGAPPTRVGGTGARGAMRPGSGQ
jgi:hypothetical protein